MFFKIGALRNFAIFIGKHLCWSLFLIKLQAWRYHRCLIDALTQVLSYEIMKFLRTAFYGTTQVAVSDVMFKVLSVFFEWGLKSWFRSSGPEVRKQPSKMLAVKKEVLKNFANFSGKHLGWNLCCSWGLWRTSANDCFWRYFAKKAVLKISLNSQKKTTSQSNFKTSVGLQPPTLIKVN